MKLAYFSPLNPQPSGISDYSEELLPHLAAEAEITLFVDGFEPANPEIHDQFTWHDYRHDPAVLNTLGDYDAVIYHMGNDHRYHAGMLDVARKHPGILVFHDFALQDFFLGLAQSRGRVETYLEELLACHGERATREAGEALLRGSTPPQIGRPIDYPLNYRLAREAEGLIVHSEWSRARFSELVSGVPVAHINMPIKPAPANHLTKSENKEPSVQSATNGVVQIANFGLITPGKGIEKALRALASLKADHDFHYTLVGELNSFFDVRALVREYDMEERVTITGHVTLEEFERRIATTDIALNLRERTVGETSASLCRIMAAGVPAIVFNVAAFSELPGNAVVKIEPDQQADALLQAYLRRLIEDPTLRKRIGENARAYILQNHDIENAANSYLDFIRQVIARRPRRQFLNNVADELSQLGIRAKDEPLLRAVAAEARALAPSEFTLRSSQFSHSASNTQPNLTPARRLPSDNGHHTKSHLGSTSQGRTPKVAGINYKQAAIQYLGEINEERQHHLRTKPFYNLANKPEKYAGEGMDADMHRHFCDFANIAVELGLPPGARILDVGCGSGWLSEYFARLGYHVKGIDISPALITMSRERVARVPYGVDHQTPLVCTFEVHDIELQPLAETFEAIICYDSLHHLEDEQSVFRHLAQMLEVGGLLFILEGQKPSPGSTAEEELREVMKLYGTLESPFSTGYLRQLISDNGFVVVGDYVSVNGLFEREMLEGDLLPLRTLPTNYHYLTCMKVADGAPANAFPDSRDPRSLRAEFTPQASLPSQVAAGSNMKIPVTIKNTGDTLWLSGQTVRTGVVMPGVKVTDERGATVIEIHGHPMLPHAVPPGRTVTLDIQIVAPWSPGNYTAKIDLVDQHVCWFEERGSQPLVFSFKVVG
jgi:2-polyprenyl-3-methyl-5-hydroxy-6-metoxy-1,4-benzoquinol methylase/glycosyltransferase involved in cell wall biosynthesis